MSVHAIPGNKLLVATLQPQRLVRATCKYIFNCCSERRLKQTNPFFNLSQPILASQSPAFSGTSSLARLSRSLSSLTSSLVAFPRAACAKFPRPMFGSQPIERLLGAPDGPNSVSTSVCTSSAVTAAAAAACCLPRRRSISTIDRSPSSDAAPRCSTRAAIIIGRSVRRAAAETFQLTSLTVQLLQFLGLGLNWMSKFFLLMTYSLLLMPGFLQVMWYYFFSPNVRRSIPYGRLPRNSLDIFVPASPSPRPRPVVIFITGGAWIIGYKAWGTLLAQALEERGVIVASIDYRNFPQATVSGMLDDVTRGIGWVLQNIHRYGGDPSRVHLAGQSAGAHLSSVAIIRQALMRASEAPPSEQQHNLSPFGSNLQQPQQQHQQQQQQDQKQQHLAVEGESSCSGVVVSVAETAAGKTEIRYPSASLAPFAPAAAASAKVHPVDAWRVNAAAASASAAVTISDVPVTSFPETGHRAPASLPVLATCADSGHPASPFPLPAAAVFPPVSSAVSPADPQAPPAAGLRGEKEAAAEALRAGTPLFRSLSMRRLLAHLAGSGGAEGNEPGRGVLDVWGSEEIKSFIGVSGCYNLINLEPQFESRGMNPYLFLSIFEGEESLPLFSPELLVSRPTFKAAAPLLPPVHLYHGVDDISVPFTASEDFGSALQTAGVETRVKLYSGKGHIDLTLQDLFRGGRDELVEDILEIVHGVDRHSPSPSHIHSHIHQSDSATSALDLAAEAACPSRPAPGTSTGAVPASQATAAAASPAPTVAPESSSFATVQGSIPAAVIVPEETKSEKLTARAADGMLTAGGGWLPIPGMQGPVAVGPRAEAQGPERKWMVPKVLLTAAKFVSPF